MSEPTPPPKSLGIEREISLTGMLFAVNEDKLVLVNMAGVAKAVAYLPLFETPEQLEATLGKVDIVYTGIKQVQEGIEFLDSLPPELVVITNLRLTEEGKTRFTQVQREGSNPPPPA
jgi:hypothetical protein